MNKSKIIDFDKEFEENADSINNLSKDISTTQQELDKNPDRLSGLENELDEITRQLDVRIMHVEAPSETKKVEDELNEDVNSFFLDYQNNIKQLDLEITEEIYKNPRLLPELSGVDISIIGIAGTIATLIDILIVSIPKEMNYMGKYQQNGSDLTGWLKTLGINKDGKLNSFFKWLEDHAKVPFDGSINPGDINNFYPGNHRMLNLDHDPLFGMIFGVIDMLRGQMTVIDGKGILHVIKTFDMPIGEQVFAPFIWLAHIVSDICTSRGIPIPGWGFTQLLQFGSFGPKDRSVADITRWMYESGYDLRHFATMSTVPASIEIIIRLYYNMSQDEPLTRNHKTSLADVETQKIQNQLKLHKMLFASHTIASAGNAAKVFLMGGNPSAINVAQWGLLLKESITMVKATTRDKTIEKVQRNRNQIDKKWESLSEHYSIMGTNA